MKRRAQKQTVSYKAKVAEYLEKHPDAESKVIAQVLNLKPQQVYSARNQLRTGRLPVTSNTVVITVELAPGKVIKFNAESVVIDHNSIQARFN